MADKRVVVPNVSSLEEFEAVFTGLVEQFLEQHRKSLKPNKSAGTRARGYLSPLAGLLKKYRQLSLEKMGGGSGKSHSVAVDESVPV